MKKIFSILAIYAMVLLSSCDKSGLNQEKTHMVMQPTWGEAFHYANICKSSQVPWTIAGIILIAIGVVLMFKWVPRFKNPMGALIAVFVVCFIGGLVFILQKPNTVRMDNVRDIPIEHYDKVGQTYLLDSMYNSNHLINANVK